MMQRAIRFLSCFLIPLALYCSAEKQDQTQTHSSAPSVQIKQHQEIWLQQADGKEHLVLRAKPHEGYSDPQLSADGNWVTVLATYPFDGGATRAEQYHLLIHVPTGEAIDKYDLRDKFHLKDRVLYFVGWAEKKPATLRVLLADGSEAQVELAATGIPR